MKTWVVRLCGEPPLWFEDWCLIKGTKNKYLAVGTTLHRARQFKLVGAARRVAQQCGGTVEVTA